MIAGGWWWWFFISRFRPDLLLLIMIMKLMSLKVLN